MTRDTTMSDILTPWTGRERCGVWFEHFFFELPNLAAQPGLSFKMAAGEIDELKKLVGEDVLGIWHSHPNGRPEPSQTDYDFHPVGCGLAVVEGGVWRVYDPEMREFLYDVTVLS